MAQCNYDALILHIIVELAVEEKNPKVQPDLQVAKHFLSLSWYNDIIFVLKHLKAPQGLDRTMTIFLKQKASRFCILEGKLYWKELGRLLLNCVYE